MSVHWGGRGPGHVSRWSAASYFNPANLFTGGIKGLAIDTLAPSSLYQDSARTTLVSAIGDPVGGPLDISPNAAHPVQATSNKRPIWDGQGIKFDGTDDTWASPAIDFSGASQVTVMFGAVKNADVATQIFVELTASAVSNNGGFFVSGAAASLQAGLRGSAFVARTFGPWQQSNVGIFWVQFDISQAAVADEIQQTINGAAPQSVTTASGTNAGTGNFANAVVYIGSRAGSTFPLNATIFRPIIIGAALADVLKTPAVTWIAQATEKRAAYADTPTTFSDSAAPVSQGGYLLTSPFAHADYTTDATVLDVDVISDFNSPTFIGVGVYVDGVFLRNCAPQNNGQTRHRVYLAAGTKTVSIVNGIQSRPDPALPVTGVFVKSVYADKPLTRVLPTPSNRILIYGDSITAGQAATPTVQNAWALLVRGATTRSVAVEAWGYRALYDDASDSTKRAAFVAKMAAYAPSTIWLAIGTNDYGLNKWSAASFGTAYAAVLDDLHAALPSAAIYCQTPIVRSTETANGSGSTTGDYRSAISTAVSTRTGFATLVDGTTFVTTGDLADGVHPTTAGHAKYATAVEALVLP